MPEWHDSANSTDSVKIMPYLDWEAGPGDEAKIYSTRENIEILIVTKNSTFRYQLLL